MAFPFSVETFPETKGRNATIRIKTSEPKHAQWAKFMAQAVGEMKMKVPFWDATRKFCGVGDPHGPGLIVVAGGIVCTLWEPMDTPGVVWRQRKLGEFKSGVLKCMTYDDTVSAKSATLTLSARDGQDQWGKPATWSMEEVNSVARAIHLAVKSS